MYFLTLESRNYINKQIPKLVKNDGSILYDQFDILNETKCFYQNLYQKREQYVDLSEINDKLNACNLPKLSENESITLEGPITKNEVLFFLKNMKNEKSPGPDGFTCEFFKFFWHDLGSFITRAINFSKQVKHFSEPNKLGIITCIPKYSEKW